jgi:hypothetical protein
MKSALLKILIVAAVFLMVGPVLSQVPDVPEEIQIPLLFKALSFDRNLTSRCGEEIVVGILYEERYRFSRTTMLNIKQRLQESGFDHLNGTPIRFIFIDVAANAKWQNTSLDEGVDIFYLSPLQSVALEDILRFSRQNQRTTICGILEDVERGVSLGVTQENGKAKLVINMAGAKAENIDFSSQLLRLARVIER